MVVVLGALAAGGCAHPLPHPWTGTTRHLCCNLRYERTTITDVNFQRGTLIPVGTAVRVTRITSTAVVFEAPGHPPITLVLKYGRRRLTLDEYLDRVLLSTDPRRELARLPRPTRRAIEAAHLAAGMSRRHVLMAIGHPPAHRTPSLASPEWLYWQNRRETFTVRFDGERVVTGSIRP